jgi:hypothetical protein
MAVQGVNTNAVSQVVDTTVNEVESKEAPVAVETPAGEAPQVGDNYGGVTKQSNQQANQAVNGSFNAADNTGNQSIDTVLDNFAAANAGNPEALAACEGAAAEIREHPEKYLNADGSVNKGALTDLITQQFASVSNVTVPSPETVATEGAQNSTAAEGAQNSTATEGAQNSTATEGAQNLGTQTISSNGIQYKNLGALADGDIMALAFIVIMEAAKSAREDLKSIMDGVKAINKEKEGWRSVANTVNSLAAKGAGKNEDYNMANDLGAMQGQSSNLSTSAIGAWDANGSSVKINTPGPDGSTNAGGLEIKGNPNLTKKDVDNAKETVKNKLDSLSEMGEMESLRLQMAMDRLSKLMSTISNLLKKSSDTQQSITQNLK